MRFIHIAIPTIAAIALAAACSSTTTFEGTGLSGTGATGAGASGAGGGGATSSGGQGGTGCPAGSEACVGGVHQICSGGVFVADPCPPGEGCEAASGSCATCLCAPGSASANCVDGTTQEICDDTCFGFAPTACGPGQVCLAGACVDTVCTPGTPHCVDTATTEICNASGTGYEPGTTCGPKEQCQDGQGCLTLCALYAQAPSSVGCSFFALNMDNFDEGHPDAIVIGNTSSTLTAVVNFYSSYGGVEALLQGNINVPPLGEYTINIPNAGSDVIHGVSRLRTGGSFRVESDIPIIAYQHSPLTPYYTNDASVLLPEATLGSHYFVPSYYDALGGYPSYFDVVGVVDGTQVTVTVPNATAAGTGVGAMAAGSTATFTLNRYDTLHVVNASGGTVAQRDLMGTEIDATAPVSVFGAVECAQVPAGYTFCDHMEEQAIPTRNWGKSYVAAHIPRRSASERYYWRVMAQTDTTTIDAQPAQTGFPVTLDKGKWYEFYTQESFTLTGDKPFTAYQYITGQDAFGAGTGDPSMITAVPVEQFLNRYVLLTPSGYGVDYVQITRTTGDDVLVDGTPVAANLYYAVGAYTVADQPVAAGPHVITSSSPFGIVGVGYTSATSYGYPGGLALNNIAPN